MLNNEYQESVQELAEAIKYINDSGAFTKIDLDANEEYHDFIVDVEKYLTEETEKEEDDEDIFEMLSVLTFLEMSNSIKRLEKKNEELENTIGIVLAIIKLQEEKEKGSHREP